MALSIAVQPVRLPAGFQVHKRYENGAVLFEFSPAVELPYDRDSLQRYHQAVMATPNGALTGPSITVEDISDLVGGVVHTTLPEFTGGSRFCYRANLNAAGLYGVGMLQNGKMLLSRIEGDKSIGGLSLDLHSEGRFFPVITEKGVERPSIDKGKITGKVHLEVDIPYPGSNSSRYMLNISAAIVAALAKQQTLTLAKDSIIKDEYEAGWPVVYMLVANPTWEKMNSAFSERKAVSEYFMEHLEPIKEAARIFTEAENLGRNYRQETVLKHQQLVGMANRARAELDPEIPAPAGIDEIVARIDAKINAKLGEATDKIAHLSAGFPKGLFQYANADCI